MKVKTIRSFRDLTENKDRLLNEEFEVTKKRYEDILKVAKYVVEVKQPKKETPKKKKGD